MTGTNTAATAVATFNARESDRLGDCLEDGCTVTASLPRQLVSS